MDQETEKLFFIKQQFTSYSEVNEQVEKYEQSTGYRLSTGDSTRRKDAPPGSAFEYSYRVFRCKKSGVLKSKSTGVRNKVSQKTNCPFTLRIKYTKVKKDKKNKNCKEFLEFLEISQLHLLHNHPPDCEPLDTSCMNDQQLLFTQEINVSEASLVLEVTNEELELSDRLNSVELHDAQASCNRTETEYKTENNANDIVNASNSESPVQEFKECNTTNGNAKSNIDVDGDPKDKICERNEPAGTKIETKTRGRPKGMAKTAIGLPIKQLISFTNLSEKSKLKKILQWLTLPDAVIHLVLNGECVLQYCDLQDKLKNLSDSFLADDIDLTQYHNYFDPKAFRFFKIAIQKLKANPVYTCKTCKSSVNDDDESIACDLCLIWFHAACVNVKLTKTVKSKAWFCNYCCSK